MKIIKSILVLFITLFILAACAGNTNNEPEKIPTPTPTAGPAEPLEVVEEVDEVVETSLLAGFVWHDMNRNGIQDSEEPGISEADVSAQGIDGLTNEATKTNGDGFYELLLPVGEYQVSFASPEGYSLTLQNQGDDSTDSDPAQADGLTEYFELSADTGESFWDAGFILDTISYGPPDNPYPDPTGPNLDDFPYGYNPLTGLPVEDPSLLGLPSMLVSVSNFPVSARPQAGLSFSPMVYEIYIGFGMTRFLTNFYGEFPKIETQIMGDCEINQEIIEDADFLLGNKVWLDENRNGLQDVKEVGIPGICVSLIDFYNGEILAETTTDSNGFYGFVVDGDGLYSIHASLPENFSFSEKDIGLDDYLDSDVYPDTGDTNPIQMMYEKDLSRDIGMYVFEIPDEPVVEEQSEEFGTIGDFVWVDLNANGIQDEGEPGKAGIEVTLYEWDISTYTQTTITDEWGFYTFEGLDDDKHYRIKLAIPTGYDFTVQYAGEDDTKDSDVNQYGHSETLMINLDGGFESSWDAGLVPTQGVGPVRSGRLPYEAFSRLFPGSCLSYAGKSSAVDIPICVWVNNNPTPDEDVNNNYFKFDKFESVARGLWIPEHGINYSGNMFSYTPPEGGIPVSEFLMFYNSLNQTKWMADPLSGGWLRFNDKADSTDIFYPSQDRLTGRQLVYNNVIVLFTDHKVLTSDGTIIDISMAYGNFGQAWLFRDGMAYPIYWSTLPGEWEKETLQTRPVKFVDADNNPVPLHPGNTWVHFVTQNTCLQENPKSGVCLNLSDNPEEWVVRFYAP